MAIKLNVISDCLNFDKKKRHQTAVLCSDGGRKVHPVRCSCKSQVCVGPMSPIRSMERSRIISSSPCSRKLRSGFKTCHTKSEGLSNKIPYNLGISL